MYSTNRLLFRDLGNFKETSYIQLFDFEGNTGGSILMWGPKLLLVYPQ